MVCLVPAIASLAICLARRGGDEKTPAATGPTYAVGGRYPQSSAAGGVTWLRLRRAGDTVMLDFAIPDTETAEKARTDPAWGDAIPSQILLENVRRFQVSAIKAPSRNGYSNDDEALKNELPPGVQLEWELEGMSWPPLIVAFDDYEMVR